MGAKRGGPSYSGVQWLDVSLALEEYMKNESGSWARWEVEPNGLGIFQLTVKLWYFQFGECFLVEISEPWKESSGRLQAFVYRSVIDAMKQIDREKAGRIAERQKAT